MALELADYMYDTGRYSEYGRVILPEIEDRSRKDPDCETMRLVWQWVNILAATGRHAELAEWGVRGMALGSALTDSLDRDAGSAKTVHRIEAEYITGGILHTNNYLLGDNPEKRTMNHSSAVRLKYAFQAPQGSMQSAIYPGAYQGLGLARHNFNPQLSNPVSVFIFQGARIAPLSRRLSFNYEWNLGLTFGWNPYDSRTNPDNRVIGSAVTAYIDADFYVNWRLTPWLDLNAGLSLSHYSNGNTEYPNAGLNTLGAKIGLAYCINRPATAPVAVRRIPAFRRHVSYDLVLFGAWRRHGMLADDGEKMYALPGTYGVAGFNFNPMYNISHWFNAGISLDGVYDRSANMYFEDGIIDAGRLRHPSAWRQMALGLSARAEFVMPYFTISLGAGKNIIGAHGDFAGIYEVLALKINMVRGTFLHIGYCLDDFKYPNYLMLRVGYRLNAKRRF